MESGSGCRFLNGRVRYSAKAPSLPRIPNTFLDGQWFSTLCLQYSHLPQPLFGAFLYHAHELMARHALEAHVAPGYLKVRGADPRERYPDQGLARAGRGVRVAALHPQSVIRYYRLPGKSISKAPF